MEWLPCQTQSTAKRTGWLAPWLRAIEGSASAPAEAARTERRVIPTAYLLSRDRRPRAHAISGLASVPDPLAGLEPCRGRGMLPFSTQGPVRERAWKRG